MLVLKAAVKYDLSYVDETGERIQKVMNMQEFEALSDDIKKAQTTRIDATIYPEPIEMAITVKQPGA
jgi:hypothetical protein